MWENASLGNVGGCWALEIETFFGPVGPKNSATGGRGPLPKLDRMKCNDVFRSVVIDLKFVDKRNNFFLILLSEGELSVERAGEGVAASILVLLYFLPC